MKWRIGGYGGTAVQALVSYDRYGTTSYFSSILSGNLMELMPAECNSIISKKMSVGTARLLLDRMIEFDSNTCDCFI